MNTLLIRELLEPFGICRQTGDPMNVHEVLLFENGAPDADDMAYVTCGAESKGQYRHALIIAIGETNIASTHMIQLTGGNVSGVMNSLIRALRRLERLNDALYAASNSQEVIDIASQKTRLPFFYFDDSYRIIAISRKIYYVIDEEWRHMTEKGFLSPGTVRLMRENGDLDYLAATDEPIIYDSELFPFICVSCNIKFHNHFVGRINMLVVDRDAYQEHLEICRIVHAHLLRLLREGKTADGDIRLRNLLTEILNEKKFLALAGHRTEATALTYYRIQREAFRSSSWISTPAKTVSFITTMRACLSRCCPASGSVSFPTRTTFCCLPSSKANPDVR